MQLYHLEKFNRLSSTVFWLDGCSTIDLIVETHRRSKNGDKFFYSEFNTKYGINAYANLIYYIELGSIYTNENGIRVKFRIDNSNIYQFTKAVETVTELLTTNTGANLFIEMKNKVIKVNPKFAPVIITGPFEGKLEFSPTVRMNNMETEFIPGISIFVNESPDPIFLNIAQFLNLSYFVERFNMYDAAMAMVNFLGRPTPIQDQQKQPKQTQTFFNMTGAKNREDDNSD